RAGARLPRLSGFGRHRPGRQSAMALHRGVRQPRTVGPRRRPHAHDLDRCLRALPRAGVSPPPYPPPQQRVEDARERAFAGEGKEWEGPPRDADGPVFREPWEAQAFAMTLALYDRGLFTWPEWAATLADEIKRAQAAGDPDTGETYYRHWLNALERI